MTARHPRPSLAAAAVKAAQAVGYSGAGTVEFIVGQRPDRSSSWR